MLDKLTEVRHHYEEIGHQLSDPTVISDNALYRNLMKEYKKLTPVVEKYNEYKHAETAFEEAKALLEEGGLEPDFRAMVQAEYDENKQRCEQAAEELWGRKPQLQEEHLAAMRELAQSTVSKVFELLKR